MILVGLLSMSTKFVECTLESNTAASTRWARRRWPDVYLTRGLPK
ncbi:hypothetical protein [Deinococcus radiodurans]|nr:hypothetical protein [Deinococcus radiodurans]